MGSKRKKGAADGGAGQAIGAAQPSIQRMAAGLLAPAISALVVACAGVLGVYILSRASGIPPSALTRDAISVGGLKPFIGILSSVGVMLLAASAGVTIFTAWSMNDGDPDARRRRRFLAWSGAGGAFLTIDDLFLLHDSILPRYAAIPEKAVVVIYAVLGIAWLAYFWRDIMRSPYPLLAVSITMLAISALMDQIFAFNEIANFIEDSAKFFGISFWLAYFAVTARDASRR